MSISTKRLVSSIQALFGRGDLTKELLILAHDSPTKFCKQVEKMLLETPNIKEFSFSYSGNEVTLFIDRRWIPKFQEAYDNSKPFPGGPGSKILLIKFLRTVAGYTKDSVMPFEDVSMMIAPLDQLYIKRPAGIPCIGLSDSKQAIADFNIFGINF